MLNPTKSRWFYPVVFVAAAAPMAWLLYNAAPAVLPAFWPDLVLPWDGDLGVNPAQTLIRTSGKDAILLLIASLAVTPARRVLGWTRAQVVRGMLGVWSFVYALTHLACYVAFDKLGNVNDIIEDVFKRQFIFVGMFTFVILLALALTSTNGMMRRLGKRWTKLHKLVYAAAITGMIHFLWGQKADISDPLFWSAVLAVLLGVRVFYAVRKRAVAVSSVSSVAPGPHPRR